MENQITRIHLGTLTDTCSYCGDATWGDLYYYDCCHSTFCGRCDNKRNHKYEEGAGYTFGYCYYCEKHPKMIISYSSPTE